MINLFLAKLSSSLYTRMSLGCGCKARTEWFYEKYFSKFSEKEAFQDFHFLKTFQKIFTKFNYIHLNLLIWKAYLLNYLVLIQGTPNYSKYLLLKILKMQYKYLVIFLKGKENIQTFTGAFQGKLASLFSFSFLLLLFLNRL